MSRVLTIAPGVCRRWSRLCLTGLLLLAGWLGAGSEAAQAQLISPGKLSRAHQDLEGIRNCTSCHALGNKGADADKCLGCHTPLQTRLRAGRGFHAGVADQNCAACHKEHFGPSFDLVRMDTTRFDHEETGFRLTGAHGAVACRTCHRPAFISARDVQVFKGRHGTLARTYLGLGTRCLSCHAPETPHAGQFVGEDCATCHVTDQWEEATRFDHDAAGFKLTGRHRQAACAGCHPAVTAPTGEAFTRYEGIAASTCATCHTDAHSGAFGAACETCHRPSGWNQVRNFSEERFDHAATGFDLLGQHARLACASCHQRPARREATLHLTFVRGTEQYTYPRLQAETCRSCHTDFHAGRFADEASGGDCQTCHTQEAWVPGTFDLERHNAASRFPLTGAHLATPCSACHHPADAPPTFRFASLDCQACHDADSPHGDQFDDAAGATACASCHTTDGWPLGATFDHAQTAFPLTGLHTEVACAGCHAAPAGAGGPPVPQYRGLATDCESCHAPDDPHQQQFGAQPCTACHATDGFAEAARTFDHSQTRFPLTGAHAEATCGQCHRPETAPAGTVFVRYRPLGLACKDCHSDG